MRWMLIRPVDSGFLDEGSSFFFFLQVIRVLSLLDHPVSIWCYFVSRVMQQHPGEVWVIYELIETQCHSICVSRLGCLPREPLETTAPCFFAPMWSSKSLFAKSLMSWKWLQNGNRCPKSHRVVTTGSVNILLQKILSYRLQGTCMTCMMNIEISSDIIDILHSLIFMSAPTSFKDNWRSGGDWKGDTHGREGYLQASRWYLWKHWSVEISKTCGVFCWRLEITWVFLFGQKLKLMRFHCLMSCVWFKFETGGEYPSSTVAGYSTNQLRQIQKRTIKCCYNYFLGSS